MGEKKFTVVNEGKVGYDTDRTSKEKVDNTLTEELVFAICAPIGSLRKVVMEEIRNEIAAYGYEVVPPIKLSDFINEYAPTIPDDQLQGTEGYRQLISKIRGGNDLRKQYNNSVLADLAIQKIGSARIRSATNTEGRLNTSQIVSERKCYIIDSIKNLEELALLRSIYRDILYVFSVFSPQQDREAELRRRGLGDYEIAELIETDDYENASYGQDVRNTFVQGDFFVRVTEANKDRTGEKIKRYLNLIFNSSVVTPLSHERAMYQAKSAAGNSACLSRQVGAAITDAAGELVAVGWNDVPKYGGNLYEEGHTNDMRCKVMGYCSNDRQKDRIAEAVADKVLTDPEFCNRIGIGKENDDVDLRSSLVQIIRKSPIKGIIEYSRAVHAEMHAIIIGSQLSANRMKGGKLFCTTYPCHNCGRHIIAAGIEEVYFIEPYVKSLTTHLHADAITEDEQEANKVKILLYDGVAPRRYLEFFSMDSDDRKINGTMKNVDKRKIVPKTRLSLQALHTLEAQAVQYLVQSGLIQEQ